MIEELVFNLLAVSLFIIIFFKILRKNDSNYVSILLLEAIGICISFVEIKLGIEANLAFTIIKYGRDRHYSIKVSDRYLNRDYYRKEEIRDYLTTWNSKDLLDYYHNNYWNKSYKTKYNGCVKKIH